MSPVNENSSASSSESTSSSSEESNNGSTKNVESVANNKWSLGQFIHSKPLVSAPQAVPTSSSVSTTGASFMGTSVLDKRTSPPTQPHHYPSNMIIKHEPLTSLIDDDLETTEHRPPTFPPLKQLPHSPTNAAEAATSASPQLAKRPTVPVIKQEPMGE